MILFQILYYFGIVKLTWSISPQFNDDLHYTITWNAPLADQAEGNLAEEIVITTNENEKYQCVLPVVTEDEKQHGDISHGPSPEVLLADVLMGDAKRCTYRLEPYWTYELCHGQRITQFHEEKDSNGLLQRNEFNLGTMTIAEVKELLYPVVPLRTPEEERKVPLRKIDNKDTPYYSIEMGNGTPCDLNRKPRKTTVLYICHPTSNNEIMSIKEVTTCEYEAIVLTPVLCGNPAYIVKTKPIHDIKCHPLSGSPIQPAKVVAQNQESKLPIFIPPQQPKQQQILRATQAAVDETLNIQFLKGDYCLVGGSGWWKYEFCNGKHISQFHVEQNLKKIVITVGRWNKKEHVDHIMSKKLKAKANTHVVHYYSGGDICDITGKPRVAQVLLICKKGIGQQLSIYMTEKSPCVYTVGVESPILCPLIAKANEFGLFETPA
ncbi:endoplasmic reticulum lectin 1-like isoform X1 [Hydractinia symbiolongicarpus]|uniref:endoplasmic reticulum lectin 1-like isoform X1 n=1 Tax=Hydractinia symbiolongicarpus TaxID=13093 RepID=UPI00254E1568|nr:endoplasmic reticulum lectin 1-like isoform X1 [Hydractinia symbiolongicarpus]